MRCRNRLPFGRRSCTTGSRATTARSGRSRRCGRACSPQATSLTSSRSTPLTSSCRPSFRRESWESRLARLPGIRQRGHDPGRWRYLLPIMPRYFSRLPLAEYDLVISSSHACAVNVRPREDALHVCYCYTPMRYAWLPETDRARVRGIKGVALRATVERLRRIDLDASKRPALYIAISRAVQERIRRFYGRDAVVVHPPVDVENFTPTAGDPDHFLWVHRLVTYKRPQLVVEAFRDLPYRLTLVGVGPLAEELRKDLPPNVTLLPWVERDELVRLFEQAGGFIHVGEEDFGISMVEALAAGTPVVALDRGGARGHRPRGARRPARLSARGWPAARRGPSGGGARVGSTRARRARDHLRPRIVRPAHARLRNVQG